jgi:hypothetical protein
MLLVVHPAIGAVLLAEAVFDDVLAGLEQYVHLGFDTRQILRMHPLAPEIRVVEIFGSRVAEQPRDVLADEGRGKIAPSPRSCRSRRVRIEQPGEARRGRGFDVGDMPALFFVVLAGCVGQDTLDDIGNGAGIGAGSQHFIKRGGGFLGVFSGRGHGRVCI